MVLEANFGPDFGSQLPTSAFLPPPIRGQINPNLPISQSVNVGDDDEHDVGLDEDDDDDGLDEDDDGYHVHAHFVSVQFCTQFI